LPASPIACCYLKGAVTHVIREIVHTDEQ
jgi:hypothetical protein